MFYHVMPERKSKQTAKKNVNKQKKFHVMNETNLSNKCVRKDFTMAKASICSKANTGLKISIFSAHKIEAVSLKYI